MFTCVFVVVTIPPHVVCGMSLLFAVWVVTLVGVRDACGFEPVASADGASKDGLKGLGVVVVVSVVVVASSSGKVAGGGLEVDVCRNVLQVLAEVPGFRAVFVEGGS